LIYIFLFFDLNFCARWYIPFCVMKWYFVYFWFISFVLFDLYFLWSSLIYIRGFIRFIFLCSLIYILFLLIYFFVFFDLYFCSLIYIFCVIWFKIYCSVDTTSIRAVIDEMTLHVLLEVEVRKGSQCHRRRRLFSLSGTSHDRCHYPEEVGANVGVD
jgi:hypothetical protein